jgi:hypothetical protein
MRCSSITALHLTEVSFPTSCQWEGEDRPMVNRVDIMADSGVVTRGFDPLVSIREARKIANEMRRELGFSD